MVIATNNADNDTEYENEDYEDDGASIDYEMPNHFVDLLRLISESSVFNHFFNLDFS